VGMFDTLRFEYPLPDSRHQDLDFQTKDLECLLDNFTITRDGRLIRNVWRAGEGFTSGTEWPFHGDIRFYTSAEDKTWIEYVARFTHGHVEWIQPLEEAGQAVEAAPPDAEEEAPMVGDAEQALLANLRRDRRELERLLQESSSHWGYEDPVYRFYHQSFKVYGLQHQTQAIVERLRALAPDRPLNSWFIEIVRSGTGKESKIEDNEHWQEVTRPILEAFFHARFFLEMAVRYSDLKVPPRSLPSGYAALLYLFGLR
jgi:hypothetical protein